MPKKRVAIVFMNLGGPDSPKAVRPFLYNLFTDPAIIAFPFPLRQIFAGIISTLRFKKTQKIYEKLGGKSPLLENTQSQAKALKEVLGNLIPEIESKIFIAMRYWHPLTQEVTQDVRDFKPDKIILLPLYPQFSTTTTGSSLTLWHELFKEQITTEVICCYPKEPGFISAYQDLIRRTVINSPQDKSIRLLFSAHGLPQKIIDKGDPYEKHVHQSVSAIMDSDLKNYEHQICYQSRVGPLKWLRPSLDEALEQAAVENRSVIVVPISFVCEHSETLVELDMDFQSRSRDLNIPYYARVPTVSCHSDFIHGLASMVVNTINDSKACIGSHCLQKGGQWCKNND